MVAEWKESCFFPFSSKRSPDFSSSETGLRVVACVVFAFVSHISDEILLRRRQGFHWFFPLMVHILKISRKVQLDFKTKSTRREEKLIEKEKKNSSWLQRAESWAAPVLKSFVWGGDGWSDGWAKVWGCSLSLSLCWRAVVKVGQEG